MNWLVPNSNWSPVFPSFVTVPKSILFKESDDGIIGFEGLPIHPNVLESCYPSTQDLFSTGNCLAWCCSDQYLIASAGPKLVCLDPSNRPDFTVLDSIQLDTPVKMVQGGGKEKNLHEKFDFLKLKMDS